MYSRNMKNDTDSYEHPFTLPERYGGSRFRLVREPSTRVHTVTTMPQTPSPIHRSPASPLPLIEETAVADTSAPDPSPWIADTFAEDPDLLSEAEKDDESDAPNENAQSKTNVEDDVSPSDGPSISGNIPGAAPALLSGLTGEDLLLIGLILLLSREGEDNSELAALLALLLAYRGSSDTK